MNILSMRATFGKLEHETLTLTPGLNLVEAPNEWGKSTWCAFLVAMLYGIDSRGKSTKARLSEKERFAPWSGSPMEGSMDLIWKERKITIQRSTKGRIPMGEFRAFETETGLDIPELTAENCGQQLLGVEKEVFLRAGFLRLSDLPVTDNEQLRSRLNALVTTGDESGSGQLLEQKLKELKNRCRYNRTGLLPQAQLQMEQLQHSITEHQLLSQQEQTLSRRVRELEEYINQLNHHKAAVRHQNAQQEHGQICEAQETVNRAKAELAELERLCGTLPSPEKALYHIQQLNQLRHRMDAMSMEEQMMPPLPSLPEPPAGFENCCAKTAVSQAKEHRSELQSLRPPKNIRAPLLLGLGALLLLCALFLLFREQSIWALGMGGAGVLCLILGLVCTFHAKHAISRYRARQIALCRQYGSNDPEQWVADAHAYAKAWEDYTGQTAVCTRLRGDLDSRKDALMRKSMEVSDSKGVSASLHHWNEILSLWDACADARRQLVQKEKQLQTLRSMVTAAPPPEGEDPLTFTEEETNRLLSDTNHELRQVLSKLGQCRGQLEALGSHDALVRQYQQAEENLRQLERVYQAVEYAQKALQEATAQLQRRFAPRISKTTQSLFSQLTGGRYQRLQLSQDLSLQIGADHEDVLRSHRWRSDGTVDQLYLALRLAVARELTPESPMVLDDALVRFDDARLKSALQLLEQESRHRQVILFTCQAREKQVMKQLSHNT